MTNELELWGFVSSRLRSSQSVMLLVVAESTGSSPGRAGYKMAVGADGELIGSIGGGVMEVNLVEQSRAMLRTQAPSCASLQRGETPRSHLSTQVHQRNSPNASGMICSGRQSVIFKRLGNNDLRAINEIIAALHEGGGSRALTVTSSDFKVGPPEGEMPNRRVQYRSIDNDFEYRERLGTADQRIDIVGGGHCALALSELMSKLDFYISIFDDRPELNTLAKNEFADRITIIDSYEQVGEHIPNDGNGYVVVMTLGYASDATVIRQLIDHNRKYLGVLGSKAKMATLMKELRAEGYSPDKLDRIHTPIGLPINSRTPEEIAVSIAAEIISIKNAA